ncbi:MAG: hypothetical protein J6S32_01645, partial [Clostridia bacterium]|nr:hypothetical protein [Clostridia bacterium]
KHHYYWKNTSSTSGEFYFEVPLSELPSQDSPWSWFHIYVYKGNATVESEVVSLDRGGAISIGQEFVFGTRKYIIQAWNGDGSQLAIQAVEI